MKIRILPVTILLVFGIGLFSCKNETTTKLSPGETPRTNFIETGAIDSSVRPQDNFWMFANGNWYKHTEIPATESSLGAFLDLRNRTREHLKLILSDISATKHDPGTIEQQVGDFYASGMDTAAIDKRGYDPAKPVLAEIKGIASLKEMMAFLAGQQTEQTSLVFNFYITTDQKNSDAYIPLLYQGGLGLPDRDYYFKTDPATQVIIVAYKDYIKTLLRLTGYDSLQVIRVSEAVYNLEKQMAAGHKTNVELRDPEANYNKMSVSELEKRFPNFDFASMLSAMRVNVDSVDVGQPEFFKKVNGLLTSVPLDVWKQYLWVHYLENAAPYLSHAFENASFEYSGKALYGQKEMKPRWQRMIAATDQNLGDALGQLYVKKYFKDDAKKRMLELVDNLSKAFEARINRVDWMGDSTKQKALEKLHAFTRKIGFPDKWQDYSSIKIDREKYFENLLATSKYAYNYEVNKLGKPVDRGEWGLTPSTINAYYNPGFNEIVFPAGILQYPFFDLNADDAVNYGAIGMGIGHEMTHGFDDEGAQFDKEGNLKNWWSQEDLKRFKEKGDKIVQLYNTYTVLDSLPVNGALTEGENIADFGGLAIAYDAFKLTKQGQDTSRIDGFTPDQRFFLAVASIWRSKMRDEVMRQLVNTDPHSPAMYRTNGPLMNFEPFYQAFGVKEGDKMFVPEKDRVTIW